MSSKGKSVKEKKSIGVDDPKIIGTIWLPTGAERVGGYVMVPYLEHEIKVEFFPAKMELIVVLNEIRMLDNECDMLPELRGWRRYPKLIPMLRNSYQQVTSLQRTVSVINRKFREAAEIVLPDEPVPPLIDTRPSFGVHLHWPFRVVAPEDHIVSWP